jgi:hypothetical protein
MGANEGEAHLISLLYDAAGQNETLPATEAGQSCAIDPSLLANDPNIDAAENTHVSVARPVSSNVIAHPDRFGNAGRFAEHRDQAQRR